MRYEVIERSESRALEETADVSMEATAGYSALSWTAANAAANARVDPWGVRGHLATIGDVDERRNLALTVFMYPALTSGVCWLGGSDVAVEGTWEWVTGERWSYTNWLSGQPDNFRSISHYLWVSHFVLHIRCEDGVYMPGFGPEEGCAFQLPMTSCKLCEVIFFVTYI